MLPHVKAGIPVEAHIAQSVEHFLGKEEVIGSNPIVSTIFLQAGDKFGKWIWGSA
jgi:hypothetical protein